MLKTRRLKNTWKLGVTRVFMIIMEKKEWEWETMRGSGGNQSEMSPHALWPVEWLLFSPGLFNKNWKNRVLYLIAVDLINVAITFAACIPFLFFFFFFIHWRRSSSSLNPCIFSYFYIALTNRSIRFDVTNPNRDTGPRFPPRVCVCRVSFPLGGGGYGKLASSRYQDGTSTLEIRNCASIDKFVRASYARYILFHKRFDPFRFPTARVWL